MQTDRTQPAPPVSAAGLIGIPRSRIWFVAAVLVYIASFWLTYETSVVPAWEYFGFGYNPDWTGSDQLFVVTLAVLPALWHPVKLERPSHFLVLVQYTIVYIPALFLAYHCTLPELGSEQRVALCLTLFASMTLLQLASRYLPLLRITRVPTQGGVYQVVLLLFMAAGMLYLWQILGSNFRIVGLEEIYDVREDASRLVESTGSRLGGYIFTWVDGVALPLLFAIALLRRNLWMGAMVIGAYLVLYGIWASKISLIAPFYLLGLFALLSIARQQVPSVFVLCCAALFALPLLLIGDGSLVTLVRVAWVGVVNVRMFCVPGFLITQYLQFFTDHPLTMGSHVTGINALIQYPYDYDIPQTVGYYYYGVLVTSNVNYWAQDGLAGFGLVGIPLISVAVAATYWLLDSIARNLDLRFTLIALGPVLFTISGNSLFTTLVTGGLLLLLFAFLFAPSSMNAKARSPALPAYVGDAS